MNSVNRFVAYEYKEISVKRGDIELYTDCLSNFDWELTEQYKAGVPGQPHNMEYSHVSDSDMMTLKFKRDSRLKNKRDINRLELECEAALAAIRRLQDKKSAYSMGIALGAGIVGASIIGTAVWNFFAGNAVAGWFLGVVGFAACGIGFFLNYKVGQRMHAELEPQIQKQYDNVYSICEEANSMLL